MLLFQDRAYVMVLALSVAFNTNVHLDLDLGVGMLCCSGFLLFSVTRSTQVFWCWGGIEPIAHDIHECHRS